MHPCRGQQSIREPWHTEARGELPPALHLSRYNVQLLMGHFPVLPRSWILLSSLGLIDFKVQGGFPINALSPYLLPHKLQTFRSFFLAEWGEASELLLSSCAHPYPFFLRAPHVQRDFSLLIQQGLLWSKFTFTSCFYLPWFGGHGFFPLSQKPTPQNKHVCLLGHVCQTEVYWLVHLHAQYFLQA